MLQSICVQFKGKKDECLSIVNQYYNLIYDTLKDDLNPQVLCMLIGICNGQQEERRLFMPLLPMVQAQKLQVSLTKIEEPKRKVLGENEPKLTKEELDTYQLPFDQLLGPQNANTLVENGNLCSICELSLHFLQEVLADPKTEDDIKQKVERICDYLPKTVTGQCQGFITSYGDAVVALLIQDIDPSEVCPKMRMCSQKANEDVEIFSLNPTINVDIKAGGEGDKPTCPLCLFAVQEAQNRIKSDKSIANIKHTLESLCNHLPQKLGMECTDFVETYSKVRG